MLAIAVIFAVTCSYVAVIFGAFFMYLSKALSSPSLPSPLPPFSSLSAFPTYSIFTVPFIPS